METINRGPRSPSRCSNRSRRLFKIQRLRAPSFLSFPTKCRRNDDLQGVNTEAFLHTDCLGLAKVFETSAVGPGIVDLRVSEASPGDLVQLYLAPEELLGRR